MTLPKGYATEKYCNNCGHADSQHTKELEITKRTFPKGMKQPEANIKVSHAACNQCDCTEYIDKEHLRWQQQKLDQEAFRRHYQQHFVEKQQPPAQTTPVAPEVNAILQATQKLCVQRGLGQCMTVDYQSANLVVIHGDFLLPFLLPSGPVFYSNFFLWEAVDKLQTTLGFRINSMTVSGAGTEVNPSVLHVVMTKPKEEEEEKEKDEVIKKENERNIH